MAAEKRNVAAAIQASDAHIQAGGHVHVGNNISIVEHMVVHGVFAAEPEQVLLHLISEKEALEKKKETLLEKTFYNPQQPAVKTKEELNTRIQKFEAQQKEAIADGEEFPLQKVTYLDACKTTLELLNHLDKEIQAIERKIRQQQGIPDIQEKIQADDAKVDGGGQIGSNVDGLAQGSFDADIDANRAVVAGKGQIGSNVAGLRGHVTSNIRANGATVTGGGQIGGNYKF